MKRRLYFLFPETESAGRAVADLDSLGVDRGVVHVLARDDIDLGQLPAATKRQRHDMLGHDEYRAWNGNLLVFGLAVFALIIATALENLIAIATAMLVILASVAGGTRFAMFMPRAHREQLRRALEHGEILLMVDLSKHCAEEVEELMHRRHPEAIDRGSSWTADLFHA